MKNAGDVLASTLVTIPSLQECILTFQATVCCGVDDAKADVSPCNEPLLVLPMSASRGVETLRERQTDRQAFTRVDTIGQSFTDSLD